MTEHDELLRTRLERLGFAGEPPMASTATDDLERGRRHLRRRRIATLGGGALGVAAAGVGVALLLPGFGPAAQSDLNVAGSGDGPAAVEAPAVPSTTATAPPEAPPVDHELGFPVTRQLLLDTAVEHLDPAHEHLDAESTGLTGGGFEDAFEVGTKLGWTVPGEDGLGLVQVAVTSPGYATADEYARAQFGGSFGCSGPDDGCEEQPVPGTDETVLVAGPNSESTLQFGVVYERADGSMVGIGVSSLFGNNSVTPVSEVGITLEQAIAFVTDPGLLVDPAEAAEDDPFGTWPETVGPEGTSTTPVD
ncbi:hypothetical protein [Jiangella mangrovi]|uniref:Uncharacterized protein n=1 Tax=Jiangella mangrovi TaxID=1524084 RepID=A0A7W9GSA1_9ACTN|nr:hypothetical protein [Jiangella mangrovi]MBB5789120.1 hypothetical protein [Jiangella mangrovi]